MHGLPQWPLCEEIYGYAQGEKEWLQWPKGGIFCRTPRRGI